MLRSAYLRFLCAATNDRTLSLPPRGSVLLPRRNALSGQPVSCHSFFTFRLNNFDFLASSIAYHTILSRTLTIRTFTSVLKLRFVSLFITHFPQTNIPAIHLRNSMLALELFCVFMA
jgi:hypothetical protein